jgi:hypothetical protein
MKKLNKLKENNNKDQKLIFNNLHLIVAKPINTISTTNE